MLIRVRRSDPVSTRDEGEGMGGLGAGSVGGPAREKSEGWSVRAEGLGGVTPTTLVGTGTSDSVDVGEATGGLGAAQGSWEDRMEEIGRSDQREREG